MTRETPVPVHRAEPFDGDLGLERGGDDQLLQTGGEVGS
jgi:hypothetical protein